MAYLYGVSFDGICYPPVDLDFFKPRGGKASPAFAVTIARSHREQGTELLERIAGKVPVKVVGRASIRGAETLGVISDERLAEVYSEASLAVAPVVSEFFGYGVAEALACGTPVLCYPLCGPGELIQDGINGWTANSPDELVELASKVVQNGYDARLGEAARTSAEKFGCVTVAKHLRAQLETKS